MKKFTKICLIIAAVMVAVGLVFVAAGTAAAGGFWSATRLVYEGSITEKNMQKLEDKWDSEWEHFDDDMDEIDDELDENMQEFEHDMEEWEEEWDEEDEWDEEWESEWNDVDWEKNYTTMFEKEFTMSAVDTVEAEEVEELDIEVRSGAIAVIPTEETQIRVECSKSEDSGYGIESYRDGDTYKVREQHQGYNGHDMENRSIKIYLPKDKVFDEVNMNIGGAVMKVENLHAEDILLRMGAGKASLKGLEAKYMKCYLGAGQITLDDMKTKDMDMGVGAGKFLYTGNITGDLSAKCGTGNIQMKLADSQDNHNYYLGAAIGNVRVGSESYGGLVSAKHIENDAESDYRLTCGIGNIEIDFH